MTFRAALRGLALIAASLAPVSLAAHAIVVDSSPADRATLAAAPETLELRFNARLEKGLTRLTLEGPDGASVPVADTADGDERIEVRLPALAPGAYTLHYKVLATDGHATQGVLRFTLKSGAAE